MKYSRSWQECYHIVCGKHLRSLYCSDQMWHFGFEWLKVLRGRVTGSCRHKCCPFRAFDSTVRKLPYPMLKPDSQHIHLNRNMDTKQTCTPRSKFGSSVQRPGLKSSWLLAPKGPQMIILVGQAIVADCQLSKHVYP